MVDKAQGQSSSNTNPFTPEFGQEPIYFAGRDRMLNDMLLDFEDGDNICALLVGARGTGKTATLTYIASEAGRFGWISASVSALPGMLEDILQRTIDAASHLDDMGKKRKVKGITLAGLGGIELEDDQDENFNWRTKMNAVLDVLNEHEIGLVITVDEVDVSLDEMKQLISVYQHFVREKRRVSLLMAGLPYSVLALLNDKATSYLRRAARYDLGPLQDYEVAEAFKLTIEEGGKAIDKTALDAAVREIGGFPFMFQLLGHRAWRQANGAPAITLENIEEGARLARIEMERRIFDTTYRDLSKSDRKFLTAMLEDDESSKRSDLAKRLGKSSGHISTYKKRLLEAGIIDETVEGNLRFCLPGFREYMQDKVNI